ncbi:hypothetical protein Ahy_B06g080866 [Arachis hypogaea]|uniref:Oxo-4-hydroxy-4-carboxy-5-ureidoimidazoline decarboxylase domain-containing protein n=1 Tax=Arachis hypogaea TaxID=3818 RepID=A0A444YJD9_ARAHY|nr:hypothetical protein Ahy_B06g080866 [Arachis hypogaea]
MKTEDFSSCYAGTTFTNEMAMTSPFSSLEHAITVARDIWYRKLNVRSWLEAISGRFCSNEYLETANEATELHEWGLKYEEKFGYVFVTFVAVSTEYSSEIVADTLDGADTNSEDDLDAIFSGGYDISRDVELNKVPEDNETLNTQHREDVVRVAKRGFDLNKLPWFGDDLSDPLSRHCSGFLTEYFWPGQYDVDEKF